MWLSRYDFSCGDTAATQAVTFYAQDISGNTDSVIRFVTVIDSLLPNLLTTDTTIYLDNTGNFTIDTTYINAGTWDNCQIDTMWLSRYDFNCGDTSATQAVTFYALDVSGNLDSATRFVTVIDSTLPFLVTHDTTVWLDQTGSYTIDTTYLNTATYDNCQIDTMWLSRYDFSCGDTVAPQSVTFYAQDISGNVDSIVRIVTVLDTLVPNLLTTDTTIWLDASGNFTIDTTYINAGSWDNCQIDTMWLSRYDFTCGDTAATQPVTFYAQDISGNVDSVTRLVTVLDTVLPTVFGRNITIALDSFGVRYIFGSDLDSASFDNCAIDTFISSIDTFNCGHIGAPVAVTFTVVDVSGNRDSTTQFVTVIDTIAPQVITQNINVYIDANGGDTITSADIDFGSWDSCSIASYSLDDSIFNCQDIGTQVLTLTVTDIHGNTSTDTATVTILDTIFPTVLVMTDTIYVDSFGNGIITPDSIDAGSFDNCSGFTRAVSVTNVGCNELGTWIPVDLIVTDSSGNTTTVTTTVFIYDTIPPVPYAFDITVNIDSFGFTEIFPTMLIDSLLDSCDIDTVYLSVDTVFCTDVGDTVQVISYAIDSIGNIGTDTSYIYVFDVFNPVVFLNDTVIYLGDSTVGNGAVTIDSASLDSASWDNCTIASIDHQTFYDCGDLGTNTITVTLTDIFGNVSSGTSDVTVLDTVSPHAYGRTITRYLNTAGTASFTVNDIDSGSYDNCGIVSRTYSPASVGCADVNDTVQVTFIATDQSGNIDTAFGYVIVLDTILPTILAGDTVLYLDSSGNASVSAWELDQGTFDNCTVDSIYLSDSLFDCSEIGVNLVLFVGVDIFGNRDTDTVSITVLDTVPPVIITQNDTVWLDSFGFAYTSVDSILVSTSNACGVDTVYLSDSIFTCVDVGLNNITITSVDVNGNSSTLGVTVLVIDSIRPTILVANDTLYLDVFGQATLDTSLFDQGTNDICGLSSYVLSETNFDCDSAGLTLTIGLTVTDVNANVTTGTVDITVLDTVRPAMAVQNITVQLDSFGNVTINSGMIDNGTADACGIASLSLNDSIFTCADVGANTVTLTAVDVNGNVDSATATVTVQDLIAPDVVTTNDTIALDASGTMVITLDSVRISSFDACGVATEVLSDTLFDCTDIGLNNVTLTVTDVNGNASVLSVTVYVIDTIAPTILVANDTLYLDASGVATLDTSLFDQGSFDNCGIASYVLSETNFDCDSAGLTLTIGLTVTDVNANVSTTSVDITVMDTVRPAMAVQNITVQLDSFGNVTINSGMIDNGTADACGIASLSLNDSIFTCADVGANTVTLTAVDVNGNVDSATATVTVQDLIAPDVVVTNDTIALDASGTMVITVDSIRVSAFDACGVATEVLSDTLFDCSQIGLNNITLTVTDVNGNVSVLNATVYVIDTIAPTLLVQDDTLFLSAAGSTFLDTSFFDLGSFDNCGIATYALSQDTFDCSDVGSTVTIGLTVTDVNGNVSIDTIDITILDTVPPTMLAQNITIQLDSFGNATIDSTMINNGSFDACGIDTMYLDQTLFTCADVGVNTVTLTATDVNGNTDSINATVTVQDNIAPDVVITNDTIAITAAGTAIITLDSIRLSAIDACGIASETLSDTLFDCTDIGINNVTLTITDVNGNSTILNATVNVIDTTPPTVLVENDTLYLDASGLATLDSSLFDLGSFDNCGIATYLLSETAFDCDSAGQVLTIDLSVTDVNGNTTDTTVDITILDTVTPAMAVQNITVQLDSFGNFTINSGMIDNGTSDACGIASLTLSDSIFSCAEVGSNTVTLVAVDVNGNIDSASATVTVEDNIAPDVVVTNDTIAITSAGTAVITLDSIRVSATDACGIASEVLSDTLFDCSNIGINNITLTVTDVNGNVSILNATVNVIDTTAPTVLVQAETLYLDVTGQATLDSSLFDLGSFDNCQIATYAISETSFDCDSAGQTLTIDLAVTDVNGNTTDTTVEITVLDTVAPAMSVQNITVQLDSAGQVIINSGMIDSGTGDACGIASLSLNDSIFDCQDVGVNTVTMTAVDVNGNVDSATATVTVEDNIAPSAFAFANLNVYLNTNGEDTIQVADIDSASFDACGIETYALSDTTFDCSDIGAPISITLTLTDSNGNVSTAQTLVTVLDTLTPIMLTQDVTIYLNDSGLATISVPMIDNGSSDNCTIDSIYLSQDSFDCSHTGSPVQVMLYTIDQSGNTDSAAAFVTVLDTIRPVITCPNDTVLFNDLDQCGALFTYATPVAYDYCGIDTVTQTDGSGFFSGDAFPVGVTIVEFTAVDVNGNLDSCSFTVTVIDTQAPVITCPSADTSICDSIFTFSPPVTSDNCSGETVAQIAGIASGQFYPVGTTTNTFVVTDASGLPDTCSFTVLRYDFPSAAYAGEDTAICELDSLALNATNPIVGDGLWTALTLGTSVSNDTLASTFGTNLQYGDNVFVWSVTNGVCAVNYDTVVIRRDETPTQANLPGTISYCEEDEVMVYANAPTVGIGTWNVISGGTIVDTLLDSTLLEDMIVGDIDIQWTIASGVCPVSSDTQRIVNLLNPTVDIGTDVVAFNGFSRQMDPVVTDAVAFTWRPASVFSDTTILDPIATIAASQTIMFFVVNDSGCVASDTALYVVNDLEDIPTGITPNNDNVNDVWNIGGIENYPDVRVLIYDQAGRKVFESNGYQQPWDGTFNGKPLPRASYYWIIDLKDGINQPLKGIISIIR